jgi:L-asparaginase II
VKPLAPSKYPARLATRVTGVELVGEVRNGRVQAVHTGHAVLLDAEGKVARAWGDPDHGVYLRSAAKPLQAVPFAGVLDELGLTNEALALACGSHEAEPDHVAVARQILEAAGVEESALQCAAHGCDPRLSGPEPPGGWLAVQNNCSGKHAAMLAVCRHHGWSIESYLESEHPLQVELRAWVARASGRQSVPFGIDGCGVPTFWLSLTEAARAMQWLNAQPADAPASRPLLAMGEYPRMVGGTGRFDTDVITATRGRVIAKIGAAGVHVAIDRASGAALAVKTDAGTSLARDVFTGNVMRAQGWLSDADVEQLRHHLEPELRNHAGRRVGEFVADLNG